MCAKKALYGLKQDPQAWCSRIGSYLQKLGFLKSDADFKLVLQSSGEQTVDIGSIC